MTRRLYWSITCRLSHALYRFADRIDPGVEHEFYVCPECNERWRRA